MQREGEELAAKVLQAVRSVVKVLRYDGGPFVCAYVSIRALSGRLFGTSHVLNGRASVTVHVFPDRLVQWR